MTQQDPFTSILDLLENVKTKGESAMARCPAHEDGTASLSVKYEHGKVLLCCHAGCDNQDVLSALNLGWEHLFSEECRSETKVHEFTYQRGDGTPYMIVERWRQGDGKKTFKQRLAGGSGYGLGDNKPALYRLPQVLAAASQGEVIYVVEGEKDVHAISRLGVTATTAPMGAGKWQPYYHKWLTGASKIIVVADNDDPGKRGAAQIAADLRGHGFAATTVLPKVGKDVSEHIAAGYGVADLVPANFNRLRPHGVEANDLLNTEFAPIQWAVEPILPEGLALFGGPPKISKSWLALDLAVAVATGRSFLDSCGVLKGNRGSVLALCLDNDSERRIKGRLKKLLSFQGFSGADLDGAGEKFGIEFHTAWPTSDEALIACQEWVNEADNPRLIIIDTLIKVEPGIDGDRASYGNSSNALSRWAKFAQDNHVTVLCIHHDRKQTEGDDWLNRFVGSRGLTATAATLWLLDAKRGEREGKLHITGRDIATGAIPLEQIGPCWAVGPDGVPSDLSNSPNPIELAPVPESITMQSNVNGPGTPVPMEYAVGSNVIPFRRH